MKRALAVAAALVGCSADNHAPTVQPASVRAYEDLTETLVIHAEDVDGDDLTLSMYSATGGFYDLEAIEQTTVDGVSRLEATVDLWGFPDFHGETEFNVGVFDGIERASATISVNIVSVNDRPTARDDSFATPSNTEIVIAGATLLGNDDDEADLDERDPPNLGLAVASVGTSTHGTVSFTNGELRFAPAADFAGTAPFTYRITDGEDTAEATVRVWVGGNNTAPIVVDDEERTMEGVPIEIDVARLLANDIDDDGHTLSVIGVKNPDHCTIELRERTILFTPKGEPGGTFFGTAGFDYSITDGTATATGHVAVEVGPWL